MEINNIKAIAYQFVREYTRAINESQAQVSKLSDSEQELFTAMVSIYYDYFQGDITKGNAEIKMNDIVKGYKNS